VIMTTAEQRIKDAWKRFQVKLVSIKQKAVQEAIKNERSESANEIEQLRKKL
jgi:hypothetical protein